MKLSSFVKNHKILTIVTVILTMFTVILISFILGAVMILSILSPYYAIGCTTFTKEAGDTFSISFDKPDMMLVNKMEVETPKGITVIEDNALISDIVECTLVAKYSGSRAIYGHYYIRLYKDDVLIRDMDLDLHGNQIRVYYPGDKHFMLYGGKNGGHVFISPELLDRLQQYLIEHGNRFGNSDGSYPE